MAPPPLFGAVLGASGLGEGARKGPIVHRSGGRTSCCARPGSISRRERGREVMTDLRYDKTQPKALSTNGWWTMLLVAFLCAEDRSSLLRPPSVCAADRCLKLFATKSAGTGGGVLTQGRSREDFPVRGQTVSLASRFAKGGGAASDRPR